MSVRGGICQDVQWDHRTTREAHSPKGALAQKIFLYRTPSLSYIGTTNELNTLLREISTYRTQVQNMFYIFRAVEVLPQ